MSRALDAVGFLSPELDGWTATCRKTHAEWFAMLESINSAGMKALYDVARPVRRNTQQLIASLLFGRALQSLQGSILLLERGMQADGRTLIRSATESTIALGGIADGDGKQAIEELTADADKHRLRLMNALMDDPESRAELGEDAPEKFAAAKTEILTEHGDDGPRALNLEALARRVKMLGIYNTIYRDFSGNGAHPTIAALMHHVLYDNAKEITELTFEPRDNELPSTLSAACSVGLCALEAVAQVFSHDATHARVRELADEWKGLCALDNSESGCV